MIFFNKNNMNLNTNNPFALLIYPLAYILSLTIKDNKRVPEIIKIITANGSIGRLMLLLIGIIAIMILMAYTIYQFN